MTRPNLLSVDLELERRGSPTLRIRFSLPLGAPVLLGVTGPSGSGKSSFLRMMAGLLPPDGGSIVMGASVWFDRSREVDRPFEERGVSYLPQNVCLFPHMNVRENLLFAAGLARAAQRKSSRFPRVFSSRRNWSADTKPEEEMERLSQVFGIADLMDKRADQISGGQARRVALARMFFKPAGLYLLDEPLTGVDPAGRQVLGSLLRERFRKAAVPVIWVTHSPEEIACIADEMAEFTLQGENDAMGWTQKALQRKERNWCESLAVRQEKNGD